VFAGGRVTWSLGTINASDSGQVTVSVVINSPLSLNSVSQISNRAAVTCAQIAPVVSNTQYTNVLYPQVAVTKTVDSATVYAGNVLTYKLIISNSTLIAATNTTVQDAIPAGATYVAGSTRRKGVLLADVSGTSPLVAGLSLGTITVSSPDTVTFEAQVSLNELDNASILNNASATTDKLTNTISSNTVQTTVKGRPVISVSKVVTPLTPAPGDTLVYTVTYTNTGGANAVNIFFADAIPTTTAYVPNSVVLNGTSQTDQSDGDAATVSGGMIQVSISSLTPAQTGTIVYKLKVR
jgi:uncharacterized repeat protein (TIGR01451 family)